MLRRFVALAVAVAVPAFASTTLEEEIVTMTERQAVAVTAAAPDCEKIGQALLATVDDDLAVLQKAHEAGKTKTVEQKKAEKAEFLKRYGARMKEATGKLAVVKSCKDHATVKQWKAKFDAAKPAPSKG